MKTREEPAVTEGLTVQQLLDLLNTFVSRSENSGWWLGRIGILPSACAAGAAFAG
jgi:hypothetical protein